MMILLDFEMPMKLFVIHIQYINNNNSKVAQW